VSTKTKPTRSPAGNSHRPHDGQSGGGKATVRRDGDAIVIDIPMNLRRRSGRKEIVLPPSVTTASVAPAKPPSPLALALARAFRWQEMIETGQAKSNSDLARKLKLDQSYVARTIRMASLAPDVIQAILSGQEPDGLSLRILRREVPLVWDEQRRMLGTEGAVPNPETSSQPALDSSPSSLAKAISPTTSPT